METSGPKAGGWSPVPLRNEHVTRVVQFVLDHLNATRVEERHALGTVTSAAHQVVAGSNYRVTFTVDPGQHVRLVTATVWEQPWLDRTEITELSLGDVPRTR